MKRTPSQAAARSPVGGWTRRRRESLHGALRPHPLDPPRAPPDAPAAWERLARLCVAAQPPRVVDRSQGEFVRRIQPRVDAVTASLARGAPPAAPLDAEQEIMRAAVVPEDPADASASALVEFWVGTEGVPFALRLLAARADFAAGIVISSSERPGPFVELSPLLRDGYDNFALRDRRWWHALRPHVLALPPVAYAAAREAAAALRRDADLALRWRVAFAFPTEPAWAARDARAVVRDWERASGFALDVPSMLLASLADAELAAGLGRLVAAAEHYLPVGAYALNMVDVLGRAAAPALRAMREASRTKAGRSAYEAALTLALAEPGAPGSASRGAGRST